jgi:hypothetical protein
VSNRDRDRPRGRQGARAEFHRFAPERNTGIAKAETRVVADVILDVPGLDEPAKGRIVSVPEKQTVLKTRE